MEWTDRYSNFPEEIDTFVEHFDIQYEDLSDVSRYQYLKTLSYLTEVQQVELSTLTNKLKDKIWFSEDLNKIMACMINLEKYFRDKTIPQLETWKQEIVAINTEYQTLSQTISQSWTTTSSTTYDIHSGNEVIDSSIELKLDAASNLTVIIDGSIIPYNNYEIRTNTSQKKTVIAFVNGYVPVVGKRMEARWSYASRQFSVSSHSHNKTDITGLPTVATTGKYTDLSNIPTSFTPSTHSHAWGEVTGKPSTFSPSSHTHDDRYFTESEVTSKLAGKSDTGHKHAVADITGLQTNLTSMQGEIDSLKSSVSSGKTSIASAITTKGVSATGSDSFATLASKVGQISSIKSPFNLYIDIAKKIGVQWGYNTWTMPPLMTKYSIAYNSSKVLGKGVFWTYTGRVTGFADVSGDVTQIADVSSHTMYVINSTATVKPYNETNYPINSQDYYYISEAEIKSYFSQY